MSRVHPTPRRSTAAGEPGPWGLLAYTMADDRSTADAIDRPAMRELRAIVRAADLTGVPVGAQADFKSVRGVFRAALSSGKAPRSSAFEPYRLDVARRRASAVHRYWANMLPRSRQAAQRFRHACVASVSPPDARDLRIWKVPANRETNGASTAELRRFLEFGLATVPAARHVLFVYGHSHGPMGLFWDRSTHARMPRTLRLNDLAGAIHRATLDPAVVVFRDCFMNSLESAFELRGTVQFMVASQSEVPITGIWPWVPMMSTLTAGARPRDVARAMAMQLGSFLDVKEHRGRFVDAPMSAIDIDASSRVTRPLQALVRELERARFDPARSRRCAVAFEEARTGLPGRPELCPGDPSLIDVPSLCAFLLRELRTDDPAANPARALSEVLRSSMVVWHSTQKTRYRGTNLYYRPVDAGHLRVSVITDDGFRAEDERYYRGLRLCRDTGWDRIALNPFPSRAPNGD